MSDSKKIILGEVATLCYGKMPNKDLLGKGNYPTFSGYKYQYLYPEFNCKIGDLIVVARGVGGTGDVKIIKEDAYLTNLSIKIDFDPDIVDNQFFYYYFHKQTLRYLDSGSAQSQITIKDLESESFLIPPLPEQKAIASVLSSLDDKIDLLHHQNKTLEAMAETLFRQWFIEEAQEEWDKGILGDIAEINPSYPLKKGEISTYLEMSNVSMSTFYPIGYYKRTFSSGMKFKNGDTLLARITPCLENGKTCYVTFLDENEIGWGSTEYIVIRMKELFHPYMSYIIAKDKDFRDFAISSMSGSSGRQRAQASVIKEYDIKIPPLEIIEELKHQLVEILPKLKNNVNQIRTLEKLRDTLLPKLMSGEVRVKFIREQ